MDSLIVLRRPLRKTQVESKFIIPKKSKKTQPKLAPIPPSPECTQPAISFVKLYEEACVGHARRSATIVLSCQPSRELLQRPSRELLQRPSRTQLSAEWPQEAPPQASLASLVTQYPGRRLHGPPPSRAAGAELVLELDYDSRSKDSAFASTRNSSF